jgi:hypothetical protein
MKSLEWIRPDSTAIERFAYDASAFALYVEFVPEGCYRYDGVPAEYFRALRLAKSAGTFVNKLIKGRFAYEKL